MSDKPAEAPKEAAAAAPAEGGHAAPDAHGGGGGGGGGGIKALLPLIIALVLAPAISWAVAQFVLFPKMKAELSALVPPPAEGAPAHGEEAHGDSHAADSHAEPKAKDAHGEAKKEGGHGEAKKEGGHSEKKKEGADKKGGDRKPDATADKITAEGPANYEFKNLVVNLSGTMGTRYLKCSFMVVGKDNLREIFEENLPKLQDATLTALGSLTLPDLEEVGSRNLLRAKLADVYNDQLNGRVVEAIYFSDFVVQ